MWIQSFILKRLLTLQNMFICLLLFPLCYLVWFLLCCSLSLNNSLSILFSHRTWWWWHGDSANNGFVILYITGIWINVCLSTPSWKKENLFIKMGDFWLHKTCASCKHCNHYTAPIFQEREIIAKPRSRLEELLSWKSVQGYICFTPVKRHVQQSIIKSV